MRYSHLPEAEVRDWILFKQYGSEVARQRLVARYVRDFDHLACWVYQRMQHRMPIHDAEDGVQAARMFLVDAVDHYDIDHPKRCKFSTFATHHIALKLLNYAHRVMRRKGPELHALTYEDLLGADYEDTPTGLPVAPEDTERRAVSQATVHDLVRRAERRLSPGEFTCFRLRFLDNGPVKHVQEALGLSYMEARGLIQRVREKVQPLAIAAGLTE